MNQSGSPESTTPVGKRLQAVRDRIAVAERAQGRAAGSVQLLAVSKTRPSSDIRQALAAGQMAFGENYLQDALEKIDQLAESGAKWHFIGRIQSNKTRLIAENFDWAHSIDTAKQLLRLNDHRPEELPPLNVCLQINVDQERSKGGLHPDAAAELIRQARELPRLRVRGLMAIPAPTSDFESQRCPFRQLRLLRDRLATQDNPLDTLSMGMSADLEAAIAEGSTIVRVGTAIFGPRQPVVRHDAIGQSVH